MAGEIDARVECAELASLSTSRRGRGQFRCRLAKDFDHLLGQAIMVNEKLTERRVREEKPEKIALPIRHHGITRLNGAKHPLSDKCTLQAALSEWVKEL
ncbi:MAG TPA: hypothetical protein VHZ51_21805 [Ktedonobacteraceae bacterium]|jgi:hypothetical protein|nr:hypothetical protein [Ktedonobacteraceae bacterium]